jgi:hypothetical protein
MLVLINGVEYYNLIDGATDTVEFLNFFQEAAEATNMETLCPVIEVGDIIVMDNLAVHHYDGGEILEDFYVRDRNQTNLYSCLFPGFESD